MAVLASASAKLPAALLSPLTPSRSPFALPPLPLALLQLLAARRVLRAHAESSSKGSADSPSAITDGDNFSQPDDRSQFWTPRAYLGPHTRMATESRCASEF